MAGEATLAPSILIVDDSALSRNSVRKLLEPLQAELSEARNGAEGLAAAAARHFDVIITDRDMPQMDGFEFCRQLKQNPATRSVPVIMVSSFDRDQEIELGFQAGATHYVPKIEATERLRDTVAGVLEEYSFRRGRKILVIDDSATIRAALADHLARAGFQVVVATCGEEALRRLPAERPDLVLSDVCMPGMDGFELCRLFRGFPGCAAIPFVAMSSISERGKMVKMLDRGAAAYLVKPFNLDQLVIMLDRLLSDQYLLLLKEKQRLDSEKKILLASITSLVSALEARDPYTCGHSEAVATILSRIATFTGESWEEIENIVTGGKLHDIGKIGVQDAILQKNGKLTDAEYAEIKKHPGTGAQILSAISSLAEILPIVRHHHERWDGGGYPAGLRGEEIPRWARMAAVADTYHALVSDRPYRRGLPHDRAMQIIEDACGSQLCPDCVELFKSWIATLDERELIAIAGKCPPAV